MRVPKAFIIREEPLPKTGSGKVSRGLLRQEAAENELDVANRKFRNLGLDPITLDEGLFEEVTEIVQKYKSRCDPKKILPASFWNKKRAAECADLDPDSIKFKEDAEEKVEN